MARFPSFLFSGRSDHSGQPGYCLPVKGLDGADMKAHGNVFEHEYEIERDGDTVIGIGQFPAQVVPLNGPYRCTGNIQPHEHFTHHHFVRTAV